MRILQNTMRLGLGAVLLAGATYAAPDPHEPVRRGGDPSYRNADYRDEGWRDRRGRYIAPVSRAIADLQRLERHTHLSNHDRKHRRKAIEDLYKFEERWRQGRFDRGKLNSAIGHIDHIHRSRGLGFRERELLAYHLRELRMFRANEGYYRGRY